MQTPVTSRNPAGGLAPKTHCCEGPAGYCREEGTRALPPRDQGKCEVLGSFLAEELPPLCPGPSPGCPPLPSCSQVRGLLQPPGSPLPEQDHEVRQWAVNMVTFSDRGIHSGPQLCPTRCTLGRAHTLTSSSPQQQGSPHREARGKQAGPQMTEDLVRGTGNV